MTLTDPNWQSWWEANREPFLEVVRQGLGPRPDAKWLAESRKQAADALRKALRSDVAAMRGSAALSLGQMGEATAMEPLVELAKKDKDVRVRQAAILAIGLLDAPRGEEVLAALAFAPLPQPERWMDKPNDRQAAFVAMGLMTRLSPETVRKIQTMGKAPSVSTTAFARSQPLKTHPLQPNPNVGPRPFTMTPLSAWSLTRPVDPADQPPPKYVTWTFARSGGTKEQLTEGSYIAALAMSTWAMSFQTDPAIAGLCRDALSKTNVPWIAGEAMLSLGRHGGAGSAGGLSHILLVTPTGEALTVNKMLTEQHQRFEALWRVRRSEAVRENFREAERTGKWSSGLGPGAYNRAMFEIWPWITWTQGRDQGPPKEWYTNRYLQLHFGGDNCDARTVVINGKKHVVYEFNWSGNGIHSTQENLSANIARVNLGVEPIVMANLRASSAIALGRIDTDESNAALWRVLREEVQRKTHKNDGAYGKADVVHFDNYDYSVLYKSQAIMSLGKLGDEKSVPILVSILQPPPPQPARGRVLTREQKDEHAGQLRSPLRAFAALALGLYSRPIHLPPGGRNYDDYVQGQEPVVATDRKNSDNIARLLAEIMANRNESEDLRAACAMALALGGRAENLAHFHTAAKSVDKSNELLIGYMTLARAMLGDKDRSLLEAVGPLLAAKNNRTDREGVVARRAAALGVGLTGLPEAVDVLSDSLHLGRYVTRESAFAATFCQDPTAVPAVADKLLAVLNNPKAKPEDRALMARCLGDLFAAERPSRLTRLSADSNYDMRIPRLSTYRAFANEFLFMFLLAPPADEWQILCPE
jgi:HEAT repeat protein